MFMKRGQAAMEFLMTYGWAILVVLVIIGALAFFGVMSPDTLLPEKCGLPLQMACKDFSVKDLASGADSVTVSFTNNGGRAMVLKEFNVTGNEAIGAAGGCFSTEVDSYDGAGAGENPANVSVANGETKSLTLNKQRPAGGAASDCSLTNTGRPKDKLKLLVKYSWQDSQNVEHTLEGELLAKVQR